MHPKWHSDNIGFECLADLSAIVQLLSTNSFNAYLDVSNHLSGVTLAS